MGLLDSNKYRLSQKSGSLTLDITSTGNSEIIDFNGSSYGLLRFIVSDIPNGADTIIVVKGSIVSGGIIRIMRDSNGNIINSITGNGEYVVDTTGLTDVYFAVTRAAASGSATIKWSLTPLYDNPNIDNCLDHIKDNTSTNVLNSQETLDVSARADVKTYTVDINKYKCLCLWVRSVTDGVMLSCRDSVSSITSYIYSSDGTIIQTITKAGMYYIPINYPANIILRNNAAVTGATAVIRPSLMAEFPKEIMDLKPLQTIATNKVTISSASVFTVFNNTDTSALLKLFKYYYICYIVKNSSEQSVGRHVVLRTQPYNDFMCEAKDISESNAYSYQTDWQEVNGISGIRVFATISDYQEGDTIEMSIIGIR